MFIRTVYTYTIPEKNRLLPSIENVKDRQVNSGFKIYQNKILGTFFSIFCKAVKLQGLDEQGELKVWYANKKSLVHWIERQRHYENIPEFRQPGTSVIFPGLNLNSFKHLVREITEKRKTQNRALENTFTRLKEEAKNGNIDASGILGLIYLTTKAGKKYLIKKAISEATPPINPISAAMECFKQVLEKDKQLFKFLRTLLLKFDYLLQQNEHGIHLRAKANLNQDDKSKFDALLSRLKEMPEQSWQRFFHLSNSELIERAHMQNSVFTDFFYGVYILTVNGYASADPMHSAHRAFRRVAVKEPSLIPLVDIILNKLGGFEVQLSGSRLVLNYNTKAYSRVS